MKLDEIYNFTDLDRELHRLCNELFTAVDALRQAGRAWAEKVNQYRRAKAVAYLTSEGTVQARQAIVDRACDTERLQAHIAEAEREACLEHVRSIRAALSAYQTLARTNQAEMEMSHVAQPAWTGRATS